MKPTSSKKQNVRQFPLVDYHYQAVTIDEFSCHCVSTRKSIRDISRDYFDTEANHDFLSEAAVFVTLVATAIVPIIAGASAAIELCRTLPF